ncbi:MAG: hypothetical protein R3Y05_02600 [bacterium]
MLIVELHKYIEELNNFKVVASFIKCHETNLLLNDLKHLSKTLGFKYIVNIKKYHHNKDTELLETYNIEEV